MKAVAVAAELRKLGAEIAPGEGGVILRFPRGNKPSPELIEAARSIKPELGILSTKAPSPGMFSAIGLSDELSRGLSALCAPEDPPANISAAKWREMRAAATAFAVEWARTASQLGWGEIELFGIHPTAPAQRLDATGLVFLLSANDSVIAVTSESARIKKASGAEQSYRRGTISNEARPVWELALKESGPAAS